MERPGCLYYQGRYGPHLCLRRPDFDFVDVTLDRQANLRCDLVKIVPVTPPGKVTSAPSSQVVDSGVWYEPQGLKVLERESIAAETTDSGILLSW